MPGRRKHDEMGFVVGVVAGVVTLHNVPEDMRLFYLAGASLGGIVGARLPDIFEPGRSSWHRKTCHSLAAGGVLGRLALLPPLAVQAYLGDVRKDAAQLRARREAMLLGDRGAAALWWAEAARYFLLGAAFAAIPGYLSHLLLDAGTPRFLPII